MSLEYWFPLTSDLHNQGIASLANASVQSGCSLSSDGKLGGCYKNTGTTANVATPISFSADQFTLMAWVRIDARVNNWRRAVGLSGSGTYIGLCCQNTNGTSVGFHYYKTIDGTNTSIFDVYPCSPTVGAWYHYAMCYDGTKYYVYMNGSLISSANANKPNIRAEMTTLWLFGGTSGGYVKDSINDVRIYSHCLSALEIAEIAKGMILHYPMTGGGRGCANLVPGQAKYTSVSPRVLTTTATDGNSWLSGSAFEVKPSTTYTFSVCCDGQIATKHATDGSEPGTFSMWLYLCNDGTTKNWQDGQYDSPICFTSSNYNHTQVGNRHMWQYTTTSTQRYMSIRLNNYGPGTVTNRYWEFKIEESPKFTLYMPNVNETEYNAMGYNDTVEYDLSGYGYHGTRINSLTFSSDTPRYSVSTHFDPGSNTAATASYIQLPALTLDFTKISFSIWGKWDTARNWSRAWEFGEKQEGQGYDITLGAGGNGTTISIGGRLSGGSALPDTSIQNMSLTTWYHIVTTIDGTTCKVYINGNLVKTFTFNSAFSTATPMNYNYIGRSNWSGNKYLDGNMSDFRMYATVLSADDILKLYNKQM